MNFIGIFSLIGCLGVLVTFSHFGAKRQADVRELQRLKNISNYFTCDAAGCFKAALLPFKGYLQLQTQIGNYYCK